MIDFTNLSLRWVQRRFNHTKPAWRLIFEKYEKGFSEPTPSEVEPYITASIWWRCQTRLLSIQQIYLLRWIQPHFNHTKSEWRRISLKSMKQTCPSSGSTYPSSCSIYKFISWNGSNDVSTTQNLHEDQSLEKVENRSRPSSWSILQTYLWDGSNDVSTTQNLHED